MTPARKAHLDRLAIPHERTCVDCGGTFEGGNAALRCPPCRQKLRTEQRHEWRSVGKSTSRGRSRGTLKAMATSVHTGRICRMCGREIVHHVDRHGYPVGP